MTVTQNLAFGLEMRRVARAEAGRRIAQALATVQLSDLGQRYPRQLSGGQQQRVALARALVIEPRVLLLDEPLANLDAKLREEVRFFIRQLQKRVGITTVYVTHDQAEAMVISDRIVVMFDGHVHQIGTPVEIYMRPASREVANFIGLSNFIEARVKAPQRRRLSARQPARRAALRLCRAPRRRRAGQRRGPARGDRADRRRAAGRSQQRHRGPGRRALFFGQHRRLQDRLRGRHRAPGAERALAHLRGRRPDLVPVRCRADLGRSPHDGHGDCRGESAQTARGPRAARARPARRAWLRGNASCSSPCRRWPADRLSCCCRT